MHALVIEDDPFVALLLCDMLERLGFTSFSMAATEARAVQLAGERPPALITADFTLANGTGLAAVEAITRTNTVPVVFVTGAPESIDATAYPFVVAKPVCEPTFLLAVKSALSRHATQDAHGSAVTRSPAPADFSNRTFGDIL